MTMKPSALASSAIAPGMNSFSNECSDAVMPLAPCSVSSFQALVICTACETAIEKIRKGTRIDIGSSPSPKTGSRPSSQITGTTAQTSARKVIIFEPEYQYSSSAVMTKATPKNTSTPAAPLAMSPTALAKPISYTPMSAFSYFVRMSSSCCATACRSSRSPVSGSFSIRVATTIAAVWSLETMRPTQSDLSRFSRTRTSCSGVPVKSAATTLPPRNPSSTTSVKRTFAVNSEVTELRSTPLM